MGSVGVKTDRGVHARVRRVGKGGRDGGTGNENSEGNLYCFIPTLLLLFFVAPALDKVHTYYHACTIKYGNELEICSNDT